MNRKKIYIEILASDYDVKYFLEELNNVLQYNIRFEVTSNSDKADIYLLIIGKKGEKSIHSNIRKIEKVTLPLIFVQRDIFNKYEIYKKKKQISSNELYKVIDKYNTEGERIWINTYTCEEEIIKSVIHIVQSPQFVFSVEKGIVRVDGKEYASNHIYVKNVGWYPLKGFYYEMYNNYASKCELISSKREFEDIPPGKTAELIVKLKVPEISGCYEVYIALKNKKYNLKNEESIRNYDVVVDSNQEKFYEISVIDTTSYIGEIRGQGEYFQKGWKLRNNTSCCWEFIELRRQNDNIIHFFSNEKDVKKYYNIQPGKTFDVLLSFYETDVEGNFTSIWKLYKPDGTEFSVDMMLKCNIQTKSNIKSNFIIENEGYIEEGIWDKIKKLLHK